ncbi:MAG: hypothetical protein IPM59_10305 [Chloracidobacterium sp.]|nr:hypothetical protein [Chloracidobacterium sp.]
MRSRITNNRRRGKLLIAALALPAFLAGSLSSCTSSVTEKKESESPFKPLPENMVSTDEMEDVDFSRFRHDNERHRDIPCLLCHQQRDEAFRPRFASHTPCAGCHTPQFENKDHPICSTCHTGPDTPELKAFPSISSFRTKFDHTSHIRLASCSTCHSTQGDGMTVPSGGDAHASCMSCHTADKVVGDRNIGSCSTCHEMGRADRIVDTTARIGFNFNHANHARISCDNCHKPLGGNRMSEIAVSEHKNLANSCATCHNSKRAFGPARMADCKRCHTELPSSGRFGVQFSHALHAKNDCASCHKPGSANFAVPNGQNAHTTCFQCHAPGKEAAAKSTCFSCHKIGGGIDIKPSRAVIPGNFAHSKHDFLGCDSCHAPSGVGMTAPTVRMHKAPGAGTNCATCHDNQGAFGEEFANCRRCHTGGQFGR